MAFCDLPLADKVCAVGDAVSFASDPGGAIGDWMAKSSGELAAAGADLAAEAVNTTTRVDLNAAWFRDNYEMILPIGLIVLVATFCAQLVRAAIRRDGQALAQAFTGTATGVLFAFTAIAFTTVAVEVVDALSDGLFKAANLSIDSAVRRIVKVAAIPGLSAMGWLVAVFAGIGAALGAFLYWCVMMVRKVGILVMVTLAVFAGAGGGWEVARRWRKGWIEATATLVVSKLLMTVIFVLGIAAMGKTEAKDGVAALADVMAGVVIMALVLLCPYATFKFVHWAASEGSDGETLHRSGGAGAQIARQHAERVGRKGVAMAATAGTGGSAAGAGAAPQGPDAIPGGFPGDIATNSTPDTGKEGGSPDALSSGDEGITSGLEKAVQPTPTSPRDDATGHLGGSSGPASGGGSPNGSGFMSASASPADASTPPPQGAPSAPHSTPSAGTGTPPSPPAGL
ncbi:ATP-binding protein [Streptomyces sp. NPDC006872]|uniref:SCO6881 family protein n=1 Tax=Streptomyces sp. NPDC006872 TaxID=3155720 RepID=UPI00340D8B44